MEIDKPSARSPGHQPKVSIDLTGTPTPQVMVACDNKLLASSGVGFGKVTVTEAMIDLTSEPSEEPHNMDGYASSSGQAPIYSSDDASDDASEDGSHVEDDDYSPASALPSPLPPLADQDSFVSTSYRLSSVDNQTDEDSDMEDEHMGDLSQESDSHLDCHSDIMDEISDAESVTHAPVTHGEMEDENATDDFDGYDNFEGDDQDCRFNPDFNSSPLVYSYSWEKADTKFIDLGEDQGSKLNIAEAAAMFQFDVSKKQHSPVHIEEPLSFSSVPHASDNAEKTTYPVENHATLPSPESGTSLVIAGLPFAGFELLEPVNAAAARNRLPSPSDAALAKSHLKTTNPPAVSPMAHALGERTGKYDFFAAREQNRATVMANPLITLATATEVSAKLADKENESVSQMEVSASTTAPVPEEAPALEPAPKEQTETRSGIDEPQDTELWLPHANMDAPFLVPTAWTTSGESFLNEPHNCPIPHQCDGHLERDMTSAATYVESKRRFEVNANQTMRRVRIQELLAQESNEARPTQAPAPCPQPMTTAPVPVETALPVLGIPARPAKRSFSDVFPESDLDSSRSQPSAGVRTWQSSSTHAAHEEAASSSRVGESIGKKTQSSHDASEQSKHGPAPASTPVTACVQQDDIRPVKRRRFAQIAACAFGGIMGGAVVLAGMIATAPIESVMNGA